MNSGGLLQDVLCHQLMELSQPVGFNVIGLMGARKASKAVAQRILQCLELPRHIEVKVSLNSRHSNISFSSATDFVLFKDTAGEMQAGFVDIHFELQGIPCSILSLFECQSRNANGYAVFRPAGAHEFIEVERILDPVVYSPLPDGSVACIVPFELR